ncbi:MAG: CvpA family protein [Mariprofundaceae bacterium]
MILFDYVLIVIVGLSMLFALWRGFMRELVSLAGLVAAFFIAGRFSRITSEFLQPWLQNQTVSDMAGFGLIFVAVLFLSGLVGVIIRKLIPSGFTLTDRLLGLLFGMVRGVLYIGLFFLIYTSYAKPDQPWLEESLFAPYTIELGNIIGSVIPPGYPLSRQEKGLVKPSKSIDESSNITGGELESTGELI